MMNEHIDKLNRLFKSCKNYIGEYHIGKNTKTAPNLDRIIRKEIPAELNAYLANEEKYIVGASIGMGRTTATLWVAVFNREITKKATEGVYLVFLMSKDLNRVFIALLQAASEIKGKDKSGKPKQGHLTQKELLKLEGRAKEIRNKLLLYDSNLTRQLGSSSNIHTASEDYQKGCIFGDEWNLEEAPEKLDDLLKKYLKLYDDYVVLYPKGSKMVSEPTIEEKKEHNDEAIHISKENMIESFIKNVKKSGLIYSDKLIRRFVSALETKPFVILSGLAGSGKTQLAIAFSRWLTKNDDQVCVVPVQSDWTNREPLLGYPDALNKGEYIVSNNVVKTIYDASVNQKDPYFLILDEMNLSYVERYFADFLSSMESGEPIFLWDKTKQKDAFIPSKIKLPSNLFIIGTMNVDETTYMFSPKVLDRANVIEFKADADSIERFLKAGSTIDREILMHKGSAFGCSFVEVAKTKIPSTSQDDNIVEDLIGFFNSLKKVNAEFGFRTASEVNRYINLALKNALSKDDAVDSAILQKLLPKLHGSRKKLTPVLSTLWGLCLKKDTDHEDNDLESIEEPLDLKNDSKYFKYPLTAEKISRMFLIAKDNGFTSFAEA